MNGRSHRDRAGARLPWVTLLGAAWALAAVLLPGAAEALQLDRAAVSEGAWWRMLTGHFTHWTPDHLAWDLVTFVILGTVVERQSRTLLAATIGMAVPSISIAIWFGQPGLASYRGLSGVDSALFAAAVALLAARARRAHNLAAASVAALALAALAFKTAAECHSGAAIFVRPDGAFVPVPLAHLVGIVAGFATAWSCATLGRRARQVREGHGGGAVRPSGPTDPSSLQRSRAEAVQSIGA